MIRFSAYLVVLSVIAPLSLLAQRTTSTISGTITDQNQGVVPGAAVEATATATGAVTQGRSNELGFFVLTNLPPGPYVMKVEKTGFQTYVQEGIVVEVDRALSVNPVLQLGSTTQQVTVSASASQVDTRSGTISYQVTTKMALDLPLNGRSVLQLLQLAPDVGAYPAGGPFIQSASRQEDSTLLASAAGGRGNSSGFYLDGGVNEDALTLVPNIYPNPDAIQEFSVETNNYSAKFGGRGGAVINAVTRGGTNQIHGTAFEFVRYYKMNGRNFFAPTQDGLKRNQYGFTAGGPVQKDKTFVFFSYQGTKLRSLPTGNIAPAPTAAQRSGNFSASLPKTQLVDPSGGAPFPGNIIPTSRLDPIALQVLAFVPVADASGLTRYTTKNIQNGNQYIGRVDRNFSNKLNVYASFLYDGLSQPATSVAQNLLAAQPTQYFRSEYGALNAAWTLRPNLVANFVTSVSYRYNLYTGTPGLPTWTTLGANVTNLIHCGPNTSLQLSIGGYFSFLQDACYTIPSTVFNAATNWSWVKGSHTIEFGVEVLKTKVVKKQDFMGDGRYDFAGSLSGDNLADFLLSRPSGFTQQANFYYVPVMTLPQAYVTDTWRATRRLSVTLGVRWNPFVPLVDEPYHQAAIFSQTAYSAGTRSTLYPNLPPGLLVQGDPGVPSRVVDTHWGLFDPRIALAYDPFGDGKTSIRAAYGMFQDQMIANNFNPVYAPFAVSTFIPFPVSTENPYQGQVNPFPVPQPTPSSFAPSLPLANGNPYLPGMQAPTIQQWNLTVERQFPAAVLLRVAYEGESAYHLESNGEINAAIYNPSLSRTQNLLITNQRRPRGQYYQSLVAYNNIGTSHYDALVVSIEKRLTHGVSFLGGYRWSKCMNELDNGIREYTSPDAKFNYGPCGYNITNQFRFSYNWILPGVPSLGFFGKQILGGWETNGILTLADGQPVSIWSGIDNSLSGIGLDRADVIGNPNFDSGRSTAQKVAKWFNTAAFTANALGTFGDSGRNNVVTPGLSNLDFSLLKNIPFKIGHFENQRLQFRAEFFNVFNHPNLAVAPAAHTNPNPFTSVNSPAFGRITLALDPRIVQFALKYSF
jgi:hypothetical protein